MPKNEPVVDGRVVSVNVGQPRTVEWFGRRVTSAIWKAPVEGRVPVRGVNLAGDDQADRRVHGGYDKAIYAYASEDYQWWSAQLGQTLAPGTFGENLTVEGIDLVAVVVGERWLVGTAVLEVSEPRFPCFKLGIRMGDSAFVDRFDEASRFGTYLRIVTPGEVAAGDAIERQAGPSGGVTIGDLVEADREPTPDLLGRIVGSAEVPESWRTHAQRVLQRHP
jgi:MOSC domain-containing protein YiiM